MEIVFVLPVYTESPIGGFKVVYEYANRLVRRGHEVTIIYPWKLRASGTRRSPRAILARWLTPQPSLSAYLAKKPDVNWISIEDKVSLVKVPNLEARYVPNADAIFATAWQTSSYVNKFPSDKGGKFYLIQHYESLFHGDKAHVDRTLQYPITKIVVSSWLKEVLQQLGAQSELIVNPVDFNVFYPTRTARNNNGIRICMLHHLLRWKGINDGVEAFKLAQRECPDIRLVMFGSKVKRVNIDCEYHFKPTDEELRQIYNSCDVFLCPSWVEGFGLTSAEALACKCSLVSTSNGGNRDYAVHEKTALLSPPKDPGRLAENLVRMVLDRELADTLARAGFECVHRFTWDDAVDKMENILSRHV
jgi:L-malate glycosyltransferase